MIKMLRALIFTFVCFSYSFLFAQEKFTLTGRITDESGKPVTEVNIIVKELAETGTITDKSGDFSLQLPSGTELTIICTHVQYKNHVFSVNGKPKTTVIKNFVIQEKINIMPIVDIEAKTERSTNLHKIDPKVIRFIPDVSGGIEATLKAFPGVAKSNELSTQYSVRGGNFDENLVYVNDIEVYRPMLIRSGEQEGLSFVNPDMVSSIQFSAGGFDAKYGDKMASVLDIRYKKPTKHASSVMASMLGASASVEGCSRNHRFTFITGFRYKTSRYVLNSLDTKGDYKPNFTDFQGFFTYDLSEKTELTLLGNYASNNYIFVPQTRETSFGTVDEALKLKIYFEGQESDKFSTLFGALTFNYRKNEFVKNSFTFSAYNAREYEKFDILGQYFLNELDKELGSDNIGDSLMNIGVGTFLNHARNKLTADVYNLQYRGSHKTETNHIQWGGNVQSEMITDNISEWEMLDSAGYSLPYTDSVVSMYSSVFSKNTLATFRVTSFIQRTTIFINDSNEYAFTIGIRENYWNFTNQLLFSPRASLSLKPNWKRNYLFRLSGGFYYQPPFYKEIRNLAGEINRDVAAQKSVHIVLGSDYILEAWGRKFKLISEIYYKYFDKLIPYKIENLRIRYYATNNSKGYAAGIDLKINGEFVPGVESWASLSVMKTMENLNDDFYYQQEDSQLVMKYPGYIPRPTDQLVNFGLFFQDYLPRNPTYKMHLSLLFGTGLPFGPPKSERYQATFRMPPYRRVDIGFSKLIKSEDAVYTKGNPLRYFKTIWIAAEIFNLLDINNTVSYQWVSDIRNHEYAVPNFLTSRRLNIKILAQF